MTIARGRAHVGLGLGLMLLAGCSTAPPSGHHAAALSDHEASACLEQARRLGIDFEPLADWSTSDGCVMSGVMRVRKTTVSWSPPLLLSCPLALRLWQFEKDSLQPTARRYYGASVKTIANMGAYSCRKMVSTHASNRMSLHAYGRAVDLSGFSLTTGQTLSVKEDWAEPGRDGQFLHEITRRACHNFSVVLSPNYNSVHTNHIHLDIGGQSLCGL